MIRSDCVYVVLRPPVLDRLSLPIISLEMGMLRLCAQFLA